MRKTIIVLFLTTIFAYNLLAEVEIGTVTALIYEYYNEPSLKYDNQGQPADQMAIYKPLVSMMTQFIWKQDRNMALLNIELYGPLGSLEGSFGKEGRLFGQLKGDTFYRGYWQDSPAYFQFGKYHTDLPYDFGAFLNTGQIEVGLDIPESFKLYYAVIFQDLFKETKFDLTTSYVNEKYHTEDSIVHLFGWNQISPIGTFKLRLPVSYIEHEEYTIVDPLLAQEIRKNRDQNWVFFPSLFHKFDEKHFSATTLFGVSGRIDMENNETHMVFGFREEFQIKWIPDSVHSNILFSILTRGDEANANYQYTSLDNKEFDSHYGSHFNYLFRQVGNKTGHITFGLKQEIKTGPFYIWFGFSTHFTYPDSTTPIFQEHLGTLISGGIKWFDPYAPGSLFELYISTFVPGNISQFAGTQQRYQGLQIVGKIQHVIF